MASASRVGGVLVILGAVTFLVWSLARLVSWTQTNRLAAGMGFMGMAGATVIAGSFVAVGVWMIGRPSPVEAHLAKQHAWRQRR